MAARDLRLGTHPVHNATRRSYAAITVDGDEQTGVAWSVGNSPFNFRLCNTIFDAGNTKSSTNSCKKKTNLSIVRHVYRLHGLMVKATSKRSIVRT